VRGTDLAAAEQMMGVDMLLVSVMAVNSEIGSLPRLRNR
jgi:cysteine sulfinate desulfinase/cysteine desulfurase-like protein